MKLIHKISYLGKFWQESANKKIFSWNLIFVFLQGSLLFFKFNDLPPEVPLFYSLPWGESQLASVVALFLLPSFSIIVILVNSILAVSFFQKSILLSRLLVVFSLIFSILVFVVLFQITNLVT